MKPPESGLSGLALPNRWTLLARLEALRRDLSRISESPCLSPSQKEDSQQGLSLPWPARVMRKPQGGDLGGITLHDMELLTGNKSF